ncbi:hypothetical protein H0H81_002646 [Sphagnurus paluster]|uniref:Uncharacterized protein n=1 Tax=Sphagnurus paluster TaxID=117069 RepID=A0A9P7KKD5_9AGAR|nr:hypothetical protein H0H81_002646 [Sphagnurus paluster]
MSIIPSTSNIATHSPGDSTLSASDTKIPEIPRNKKKRKRRREDDDQEPDVDGEVKEKKKKKKKRHAEEETVEEHIVVDPVAPVQQSDEHPVKQKKSKKKKDQECQTEPQIDPALLSPETQEVTATELISAIVAAATNSPDAISAPDNVQPPPIQPQFDPNMVPHPSQQHYMVYPYMPPYGYAPPPYMPPMPPPPTVFPPQTSLPFSELTFGSNEDVLRALQALDMSKINNVLKTLGDAASASSEPGSAGLPTLTPLGQVPVPSGAIMGLGQAAEAAEAAMHHRRVLQLHLPPTEQHTTPDHAYILANRWMNAQKLAEMVKTEGLVYKKGKFSAMEEQQLKAAIEDYKIASLSHDDLMELIFPKSEKNRDNAFWSEITSAVPQRPIISVYHHVRRSHHPLAKQGSWSPAEDAMLEQTVMALGQQWEKISAKVGRMSSDCRDRYRNHIVDRHVRVTGPWSKAEEDQLIRIVTDMTIKQGKDIDNDVFWGRVKIMDILRVKKAQMPAPPPIKRKERKVTSAEVVEENNMGVAGSSTGPGTAGNTSNSAETVENNGDSDSDSDSSDDYSD